MENKYINDLKNELINEQFLKTKPYDYAENLKCQFQKNPSMWFNVIIPKTKAEELLKTTNNDYSKIWQTHCYCCWCEIDKSTQEECYVSEDGFTFLCAECYKVMFKTK